MQYLTRWRLGLEEFCDTANNARASKALVVGDFLFFGLATELLGVDTVEVGLIAALPT